MLKKPETVDLFITKYALTSGIRKYPCEIVNDMAVYRPSANRMRQHFHVEGRDWHRTWEAALKRANEMRDKKVEAMLKGAARINAMSFKEPT